MDEILKKCTHCGNWKNIGEFSKDKKYNDGLDIWCRVCKRQSTKQWQENHKEEVKQYRKQWNEGHKEYHLQWSRKNKEKEAKRSRQYYWEHKKERLEYRKEYVKNHKKEEAKRFQQYRKEHPEYFHKYDAQKRTRKANLPFQFGEKDKKTALKYFNNCCAFCGRSFDVLPKATYLSFDHWIPLHDQRLDNPGTVSTNMLPSCCGIDGCNNKKNSSDPKEWCIREFGEEKAKEIITRIENYFKWVKNNDNNSGSGQEIQSGTGTCGI